MSNALASRFHMALEVPESLRECAGCPDPLSYSSELDDVRSVLSDLCGIFADQGGFRFVVRGFGSGDWRASVRTDLMVVLEQLPSVLGAVRSAQPIELDFFEQALQRSVWIAGDGEHVILRCTSRLPTWRPREEQLRMPREEVEKMLEDLAQAFLGATRDACPRLANHPWLVEWASELRGNA